MPSLGGGDAFGAGSAIASDGLAAAFADDTRGRTGARADSGPGGATFGDVLGDSDEDDLARPERPARFAGLDEGRGGRAAFTAPTVRTGAPADGAAAASASAAKSSPVRFVRPEVSADVAVGRTPDRTGAAVGDAGFGEGDSDSEGDAGAVPTSPESALGSAPRGFGEPGSRPEPEAAAVESAPIGPYMRDMREFLSRPLPREVGCVACYIERGKPGMFGGQPTYSLYTKEGDRFLLAGRKRAGKRTSNYIVTSDKRDLSREGTNFMGKLRGNFMGTEYVVYDNGEAPGSRKGAASVRQELALVEYQSNVMTSRGPRKMKVCVPRVNPADGSRVVYQPSEGEDTMAGLFKAGHTQDMVIMVNKPPKWNDAVKAFVLNFNGRVTMASVKNFQLVTPDDHDRVVLQFGRVGKDLFTMDVQWPLSPLQAFSICLSSFDYKLACE